MVFPLTIKGDEPVNAGMVQKKFGYHGVGQQRDLSSGEIFPNYTDCRRGHHRITDPVNGADEDLPDGVVPEFFHAASSVDRGTAPPGTGSITGMPSITG